jgi:hypothetical protein
MVDLELLRETISTLLNSSQLWFWLKQVRL